MTTLTEGNLRMAFPPDVTARRFDDGASHGLSHCMKAVDFIVEEANRVSFIEIKDPEHPCAVPENKEKFVNRFLSGKLDKDLKYKYRDTFLYQWAAGKIHKPVRYLVIVAIENLTTATLSARTNHLKRNLPVNGPSSEKWIQPIVTDCMVFNIRTWNRHLPRFPLSRIP